MRIYFLPKCLSCCPTTVGEWNVSVFYLLILPCNRCPSVFCSRCHFLPLLIFGFSQSISFSVRNHPWKPPKAHSPGHKVLLYATWWPLMVKCYQDPRSLHCRETISTHFFLFFSSSSLFSLSTFSMGLVIGQKKWYIRRERKKERIVFFLTVSQQPRKDDPYEASGLDMWERGSVTGNFASHASNLLLLLFCFLFFSFFFFFHVQS